MRCEVRIEAHQVMACESGGNKKEKRLDAVTMSQT